MFGNHLLLTVLPTNMCFVRNRYHKKEDIDNWLIINERTAEIKLSKLPDRESKYLINGTYYTKIICITNGKLRR